MKNRGVFGLISIPVFRFALMIGIVFFVWQCTTSSLAHVRQTRHIQSKNIEKKRGAKDGKVLLVIEESTRGLLVEAGTVERMFSEKLSGSDLSVTSISDLNEKDAMRFKQVIQKLQQADKKAGSSIPFAVVVTGKISLNSLDPFNGLYIAEASLILKAIDTHDGKTIAIENLSGVRSYGNSQDQANKNALKDAGEKISEKFVKQIATAAH